MQETTLNAGDKAHTTKPPRSASLVCGNTSPARTHLQDPLDGTHEPATDTDGPQNIGMSESFPPGVAAAAVGVTRDHNMTSKQQPLGRCLFPRLTCRRRPDRWSTCLQKTPRQEDPGVGAPRVTDMTLGKEFAACLGVRACGRLWC